MPEETVAQTEEQTPEKKPEPEAKQEHHEDQTTISEYLESLLVTVILALFGTSFIVQAFKIPSASMEGTLLIGDHLLVNKFIFGGTGAWYEKVLPYRQLERGDIIVFKYPYADHQHFVKRVIGLPGDHLKVVDGDVYINGKHLNEPYAVHDSSVFADPFNYSFPPARGQMMSPMAAGDPQVCSRGRDRCSAREVFRHGRQSRSQPRQPLLGVRRPRRHHGAALPYLLVGRREE
jgi:signal peptidase I